MKTFLKNIAIFTIGFLIINVLIYHFLFKPAIFDKYLFNDNTIESYNIFLVSDSHGEFLGNTPSKNKIYNFSNTSENYLDMYLKVQYLTSVLGKNDTILLAVDNHNLSSYRNGFGRINENIIYADDFSEIEPSAIQTDFHFKKFTKYIPLLQPEYNKSVIQYATRSDSKTTKIQRYSSLRPEEKEKALRKRFLEQFENKTVSHQQKEYLQKIVTLCKNKNITLVGLRFPITKDYYSMIKENDFGINDFWKSQDLPIIDMHNMFFANDDYFADPDHLNKIGAEVFCKEIHTRLQEI